MGIDWETLLDAEGEDIIYAYEEHVANAWISDSHSDD